MKPESEMAARIADLERALAREREISAAERRRAELLTEACKRAYKFAADGRRDRPGPPDDAV